MTPHMFSWIWNPERTIRSSRFTSFIAQAIKIHAPPSIQSWLVCWQEQRAPQGHLQPQSQNFNGGRSGSLGPYSLATVHPFQQRFTSPHALQHQHYVIQWHVIIHDSPWFIACFKCSQMCLGYMPLLMMTAAPSWTGRSSNALIHSSAHTAIWEDPAWLKICLWQLPSSIISAQRKVETFECHRKLLFISKSLI